MTSPTPEHDRRAGTPNSGEPMHPEVLAAYAYVGTAVATADVNAYGSPAWYGWALREAFLAGCTHAQAAAPLTDEWLARRALLAADCPPASAVIMLAPLRRALGIPAASTP